MKMTKKLLALVGGVAILTSAFVFTGCKSEDDDDEFEAITGSNNDYEINFTNETDGMYRAYKTTFNKHLGGLCQISVEKDSTGDGTIGYIFDLESNPNRAAKDPRTLCIVGFNLGTANIAKPYVSRFNNVTDIQADNFGTKLTENPATEKEYIKLGSKTMNLSDCLVSAENKYYFTVDVNGNNTTGYVVKGYAGKVENAELASKTPAFEYTIPKADLYPNLAADAKITQQAAAVYVNVFQGKTMKAKWHYADTYKSAEVVEE
ncbi:MAG: hypothetical protein PUE30_05375 [Spirochaetia bacterium]|nr:hypothetical protein [Spirochaetia bacterium]